MDGGISGKRAAQNQSLYRSINEDVMTINTVFEDVAHAKRCVRIRVRSSSTRATSTPRSNASWPGTGAT